MNGVIVFRIDFNLRERELKIEGELKKNIARVVHSTYEISYPTTSEITR